MEEYEKLAKTNNAIVSTTILLAIKLRYFSVNCEHPVASLRINELVEVTNISRPTLVKCLDEMEKLRIIYRVTELKGEKHNGEIIKLATLYSSVFLGREVLGAILSELEEKWNLKTIYATITRN